MRVMINGFTIALVALLLPNIQVVDNRIGTYLLLGLGLGLINAFVKPIVQVLTLSPYFCLLRAGRGCD